MEHRYRSGAAWVPCIFASIFGCHGTKRFVGIIPTLLRFDGLENLGGLIRVGEDSTVILPVTLYPPMGAKSESYLN